MHKSVINLVVSCKIWSCQGAEDCHLMGWDARCSAKAARSSEMSARTCHNTRRHSLQDKSA